MEKEILEKILKKIEKITDVDINKIDIECIEQYLINGDVYIVYEDEDYILHLLKNDKEICKGHDVYIYGDGIYGYMDENNEIHNFNKDGVKIKWEN